ncbi:MAG: DEAD/DEAH box helicase [Prevotellaceae bacterium]|jgi:ATP-dependent RNA helicase DeaD|nr:DEAD/DEAH box helicase [Prevotellaceae bacterium]
MENNSKPAEEIVDFNDFGLSEATLEALKVKGFETPSPIQRLAIPALMRGDKDIIAQAQTGTGKTAAFGLPIMEQLEPNGKVQALILAPTRELALQVSDEIISFKGTRNMSIATIYGGASISEQLRRLKKGVDIVVGTPSRVIDHINRGSLDLSGIRWFILDEADEMLNMGFIDDIEQIFQNTPDERRVMLFSATMPDRIAKMAKKYMRDIEHLKVEAKQLTTDLTDQIYFEVSQADRFDALTRIIDVEPEFYGMVFCRTKVTTDDVVRKLLERGYEADGLHGDLTQIAREKILWRFRNKQINILVATDVAARGIDINDMTHVINYSMPQDFDSYVHRIGRTGRAGKEGTAITFISSNEYRQLMQMQKVIKTQIRKETLPKASDVIAVKRNRIKDDLAEIIELGTFNDYLPLAQEIIEEYGDETALAAIIRLAFKNELDIKNYSEIRTFSVDKRGTARLFISLGKFDDMSPRDLVDFLKKHTKLTDSKIDDVKVMDSFSFATVPFEDAEDALRMLNALRGKNEKPLAEISKKERSGGDGESGGRGDFAPQRGRGGFRGDRGGDRGERRGGGDRKGGGRGYRR